MTGYSFEIAWRNLLKDGWSTLLVVLTLAVGVGSSMTVYSLLEAMARDPIPHKSRQLFAPRLDTVGPRARASMAGARGWNSGLPDVLMTYRDAVALRDARLGVRQAVMYGTGFVASAEGAHALPGQVRATDADFFGMFEVPFVEGAGWGAEEDASGARVAVVSEAIATRLFGLDAMRDVVGRSITLDGHAFRIVGVTRQWDPKPLFYSLGFENTAAAFVPGEEIFVPLSAAIALIRDGVNTTTSCAREVEVRGIPARTREDWLRGECLWTQLWVELPDRAAVSRYRSWLEGYAAEQQRSGRMDWDPRVTLHDVREWLVAYGAVPDEYRLASLLAFGFLAVCVVNAMGLMLLRFRRRAMDLALRHALGASRRTLFAHCLAEATLIGVASGALGVLLSGTGIVAQRHLLAAELAPLARLDLGMLALTIAIAVAAALVAGLYPAWRVTRLRGAPASRSRAPGSIGGRLLVAAQVAATLALVVNALFIAWQKFETVRRPTNVDGRNMFFVVSSWSGEPGGFAARVARDIRELQSIPAVLAASAASPPLMGDNWGTPVSSSADPRATPTLATIFRVDEHALDAWGARLIEGRWFRPEEVGRGGRPPANVTVVNRSLAVREFGGVRQALGERLHLQLFRSNSTSTVVGVVEDVPGSFFSSADQPYSMFYPLTLVRGGTTTYSVRARPGSLDEAMRESLDRLRAIDPVRALGHPLMERMSGSGTAAVPFEDFSALTRRADRGLVLMLLGTSLLLVVVACLGILGISGNWILQRRHQIGVLRALGARRRDILRQSQLENLSVVATGVLAGGIAAHVINLWLVGRFAMSPLSPAWVPAGAVAIVVLAQLAALWPAVQGTLVPPATAARAR